MCALGAALLARAELIVAASWVDGIEMSLTAARDLSLPVPKLRCCILHVHVMLAVISIMHVYAPFTQHTSTIKLLLLAMQ